MNGYGEFIFKDLKKYLGFYSFDKQQGFGIFINPNQQKAFIGFWFEGKQHGVGKYVTQKNITNKNTERYGFWNNGIISEWYESKDDAISHILKSQSKYLNLFGLLYSELLDLTQN